MVNSKNIIWCHYTFSHQYRPSSQGSVLSPVFFSVYTIDLITLKFVIIKSMVITDGIRSQTRPNSVTDESNLSNRYSEENRISSLCNYWDLLLRHKKCCFPDTPDMILNHINVSFSHNVKYLGVGDRQLTLFCEFINSVVTKWTLWQQKLVKHSNAHGQKFCFLELNKSG